MKNLISFLNVDEERRTASMVHARIDQTLMMKVRDDDNNRHENTDQQHHSDCTNRNSSSVVEEDDDDRRANHKDEIDYRRSHYAYLDTNDPVHQNHRHYD